MNVFYTFSFANISERNKALSKLMWSSPKSGDAFQTEFTLNNAIQKMEQGFLL